jgi:hypothetical protein
MIIHYGAMVKRFCLDWQFKCPAFSGGCLLQRQDAIKYNANGSKHWYAGVQVFGFMFDLLCGARNCSPIILGDENGQL